MRVTDLSIEQMNELKERFYYDVLPDNDIMWKDIRGYEDIPSEVILKHYKDTVFHNSDFFCTMNEGD